MPFNGQADIDFALEMATAIALRQLKQNPWIPRLYQSGVRWKRDVCRARDIPGACERFLSPLDVLKEGKRGDCDDLAPWRAAERMLHMGDKKARAISVRSPGVGYHVLVRKGPRFRSKGEYEDPSKVLGMGGSA